MPKRAIFRLYLRPCLNDTTVNNGKWTKYDGFSTIFDVFFRKGLTFREDFARLVWGQECNTPLPPDCKNCMIISICI